MITTQELYSLRCEACGNGIVAMTPTPLLEALLDRVGEPAQIWGISKEPSEGSPVWIPYTQAMGFDSELVQMVVDGGDSIAYLYDIEDSHFFVLSKQSLIVFSFQASMS
jgi:hypothetical protein